MSKKNMNQVEDQFATETEAEAEKLRQFKESKRAAAQRFKERRAEEKVQRVEGAKALIDDLTKQGIWDKLSAQSKDYITSLTVQSTANTSSLFSKLFGTDAQPGATVTLMEAFTKTDGGVTKNKLDAYCRKWAKNGTIVTFKQDANILNSIYTVEKIGDPAATAAAEEPVA